MTQSRGAVEPPFFKRSVQLTIAVAALLASLFQAVWLSRLLRREAVQNSQANGWRLEDDESSRSDRPLIQIDLNRAQARELTLLPGVGPVLARRIVENRNRLGSTELGTRRLSGFGLSPTSIATRFPKQAPRSGLAHDAHRGGTLDSRLRNA
jgi:hypothetical protein